MKIVLFRDGKPGVVAKLPGENPEVELTDLLGGETEMISLNERLVVVVRKDGERSPADDDRPVRYQIHRLGREILPVAGDCAVVAVRLDGGLRDVGTFEVVAAEACVQPVRK